MTKFKLLRGNLTARFYFQRPTFDFNNFGAHFCEMIYGVLVPEYAVSASDFSSNSGSRLTDLWARFNLFSGPNSVTLSSDQLVFEFVNLIPGDYPVIYDVMGRIHDAVPDAFPKREFARAETLSLLHLQLEPPDSVDKYLAQFRNDRMVSAFSDLGPASEKAHPRFDVSAVDQNWSTRFGVTQSLMSNDAIFMDLAMDFRDFEPNTTFSNKLLFAQHLANASVRSLGLEDAHAQ